MKYSEIFYLKCFYAFIYESIAIVGLISSAYTLYFRVGSAVCCYFCIWDLRRASDPVYKKNLYEKRKEAYSQSLCRPITEKLLKPLVEKYGSLDILKHPMQGLVLFYDMQKSRTGKNDCLVIKVKILEL